MSADPPHAPGHRAVEPTDDQADDSKGSFQKLTTDFARLLGLGNFNRFLSLVLSVWFVLIAFVVVLCIDADAAWQRAFNPFYVFSSVHRLRDVQVRAFEIPLVSDLPSIILMLTATSSWVTYCILRRYRKSLKADLYASGLLKEEEGSNEENTQIDEAFDVMIWKTRRGPVLTTIILLVTVAVGVVFYALVYHGGYLFRHVSALTDGRLSPSEVRKSWWAAHNLLLASSWVAIGSIGTFFALLQAWDYVQIVALCKKLGSMNVLNHVPLWQAEQYGWRPLTRLVDLKAVGSVTFIFAYIPIFYLLYDINTYVTVILVVVLVIVSIVTYLQLRILRVIPDMHKTVVKARLNALGVEIRPLIESELAHSLEVDGYARLTLFTLRIEQLHSAQDARMYRYIRAAQVLGPLIAVIGLVSAVVTIYTAAK